MFGTSKDARRPALLIGTAKIAALMIGLSFLAANWLSASRLDRLAGNTSPGYEDPVTTGSIAWGSNQTRLDPCTGSRRP